MTVRMDDSLNNRTRRKSEIGLMLAVSGGTLLGIVSPNIAPFQIGVLADRYGFGEGRAGALATAELLVLSVTSLFASFLFSRIAYTRLAQFGLLVSVLGGMVTMASSTFMTIACARIGAAVGLGMIYAAANGAGAQAANPTRLYAYATTLALIVVALLLPAVAAASNTAGLVGIYLLISALSVAILPLLGGLGTARPRTANSQKLLLPAPSRDLWLVLAATVAFNMGAGAVWSYYERIGLALGISLPSIGALAGTAALAGIPGSLAVIGAERRFGRSIPAVLALMMVGMACYLLPMAPNASFFAAASFLYWMAYMFLYPMLISIAAQLDSGGWASSLVAGALMTSYSLGPLVASLIVATASFTALAAMGGGSCLFAVLFLIPPARALDLKDRPS